jgi:HEAT repeat protein
MPLTRALQRADLPEETRRRLLAVREALDARAADSLVAVLAGADPFVREATLTSLARLDGDFPIEALVKLIRIDDPALRNAAIETLGCLGERAIDRIEPLLADDDPHLRICALNALEGTESCRAAKIALRVALSDPHVNVCAAAVDVVARCGDPDMAAALRAAPARFPEHPFLNVAVRAALQEIG